MLMHLTATKGRLNQLVNRAIKGSPYGAKNLNLSYFYKLVAPTGHNMTTLCITQPICPCGTTHL